METNVNSTTEPQHDAKLPVSRRTFKAFDNGLEKIEATAETMEEAIQIAFDIFGERTLLWTFRWVD
jgi:hypothetical protein